MQTSPRPCRSSSRDGIHNVLKTASSHDAFAMSQTQSTAADGAGRKHANGINSFTLET